MRRRLAPAALATALSAPAAASPPGLHLHFGPELVVPLDRLADRADPGPGGRLRAGARFDLDEFHLVPAVGGTYARLPAATGSPVRLATATGGVRFELHEDRVTLAADLHAGYGHLREPAGDADGFALEVGGELGYALTAGVRFSLRVAQTHVFTDPRGAVGPTGRRWIALGPMLDLHP